MNKALYWSDENVRWSHPRFVDLLGSVEDEEVVDDSLSLSKEDPSIEEPLRTLWMDLTASK